MSETDEIYERYLQRAIREINTLGEEIASCGRIAHPAPVPVLGSGHPLADVFLLKYRPQPAEVQEGVAFYGRSGAAVLKSLRRLGVDPLLIYGTNCVKCSDGDPDAAHAACPIWLLRELAIVEPRIVVVHGRGGGRRAERPRGPALDARSTGRWWARCSRSRRRSRRS